MQTWRLSGGLHESEPREAADHVRFRGPFAGDGNEPHDRRAMLRQDDVFAAPREVDVVVGVSEVDGSLELDTSSLTGLNGGGAERERDVAMAGPCSEKSWP